MNGEKETCKVKRHSGVKNVMWGIVGLFIGINLIYIGSTGTIPGGYPLAEVTATITGFITSTVGISSLVIGLRKIIIRA